MTEEINNRAALYKKKLAVMKAVKSVAKDGRNTHQNFDFVSREEVYSKIRLAMVEANLAVDGSMTNVTDADKEGSRIITFEFFLIDTETGHMESRTWMQPGYEIAKSSKGTYTDPYGFAKAETYAMKQWLMTTFLLSSKEDAEIEQDAIRNQGEIINLFHGETFIEVAENATGLEREQIQEHLRDKFSGQPKDPVAWLKSLVEYKAELALQVAGVDLKSELEEAATSGLNGENKVIAPDFAQKSDDPVVGDKSVAEEEKEPIPWESLDQDTKRNIMTAFVERLAEENNRKPEEIRSILKASGLSYNNSPQTEMVIADFVAKAVSQDEKSLDAGFNGSRNLKKNGFATKSEDPVAVDDISEDDEPLVIHDDVQFGDEIDTSTYGIDDESDLDGVPESVSGLDELDELAELTDFT